MNLVFQIDELLRLIIAEVARLPGRHARRALHSLVLTNHAFSSHALGHLWAKLSLDNSAAQWVELAMSMDPSCLHLIPEDGDGGDVEIEQTQAIVGGFSRDRWPLRFVVATNAQSRTELWLTPRFTFYADRVQTLEYNQGLISSVSSRIDDSVYSLWLAYQQERNRPLFPNLRRVALAFPWDEPTTSPALNFMQTLITLSKPADFELVVSVYTAEVDELDLSRHLNLIPKGPQLSRLCVHAPSAYTFSSDIIQFTQQSLNLRSLFLGSHLVMSSQELMMLTKLPHLEKLALGSLTPSSFAPSKGYFFPTLTQLELHQLPDIIELHALLKMITTPRLYYLNCRVRALPSHISLFMFPEALSAHSYLSTLCIWTPRGSLEVNFDFFLRFLEALPKSLVSLSLPFVNPPLEHTALVNLITHAPLNLRGLNFASSFGRRGLCATDFLALVNRFPASESAWPLTILTLDEGGVETLFAAAREGNKAHSPSPLALGGDPGPDTNLEQLAQAIADVFPEAKNVKAHTREERLYKLEDMIARIFHVRQDI